MRILLDTHVFLWWVNADAKLSKPAKEIILNATEIYVSSASIWEACIKEKIGKLEVDIEKLAKAISESGFLELPITAKHAIEVYRLPDLHRDPFDRIMIAQAICEPLQFLTADKILQSYTDLVRVI
jgi:PIN domain nuclease of toxin-antitoxin system